MSAVDDVTRPQNVRLSDSGRAVRILDQSLLPNQTVYLELSGLGELYEAIASLRVRGAPAIGIFAGYAMYVLSLQTAAEDADSFLAECRANRDCLNSSRPTAVNLQRMLDRQLTSAQSARGGGIAEMQRAMLRTAEAIRREDIAMCRAISEHGLGLIKPGDGILTHCNAGPLATSEYGTALGPVFLAHERGIPLHVWCDETRPLLQGARLTAYELQSAGIDCTLICDNMASLVMRQGRINACFVGCDRVARNGDTANKIGTSGVAVLAAYYGIPFYVLGPSSTIDPDCPDGAHIPIELRDEEEIKSRFFASPTAPPEVRCYNPAFDVTDHTLITAIVTERGVCYPPFEASLSAGGGDMSAYPTDREAIEQILDVGKKLFQRGLVAANDGNLSVRVGENAVWVTPSGVSKGSMTEQMLVKLDLDGALLCGTAKPSSETGMHLRIYREDPLVRAVVHAHPPAATAFAAAGLPLKRPVLQEAVVQLGTVPLAPFALPGSPEVAESVAPYVRGGSRALLLEYHGAVAWGDTMQQAYFRMECLEQWAKVELNLRALGSSRAIPPEQVARLEALRPSWGVR